MERNRKDIVGDALHAYFWKQEERNFQKKRATLSHPLIFVEMPRIELGSKKASKKPSTCLVTN